MYGALKKLCCRKSKVVGVLAMFVVVLSLVGWWRNSDPSADPTANTYVQVPDSDVKLWSADGRELSHWNSTFYVRADAEKITYKNLTFNPKLEREKMEKAISELSIEPLLKNVEKSEFSFTLLNNGMVLGYGGFTRKPGSFGPGRDLILIDPKTKTMKKFGELQVPRQYTSVVQLDGSVIFFGGETTRKYADNHSDSLTNTVEQLDLSSGKTKVIGRIEMARREVIAEVLNGRDILIVGGWNQREIARDERWWPGAEIFRVPAKDNGSG